MPGFTEYSINLNQCVFVLPDSPQQNQFFFPENDVIAEITYQSLHQYILASLKNSLKGLPPLKNDSFSKCVIAGTG